MRCGNNIYNIKILAPVRIVIAVKYTDICVFTGELTRAIMKKWIKRLFKKDNNNSATFSSESVCGKRIDNVAISSVMSQFDITAIKEFAVKGWTLGETHGLSHWQRVERNGIILSLENGAVREGVNVKVVRAFAYLHDKCRVDDWEDIEHGVRAADMLPGIRNTVLKDFTDDEVALLQQACRYHTTKRRTGCATVDICFDADRLDLGRVGIIPNPRKMATEQGAYYAANIHLIMNCPAIEPPYLE